MSAVEALKVWLCGRDVLTTARCLRREPNAWSDDSRSMGNPYRLTHTSGLSVWVANSVYGMGIDGTGVSHHRPRIWGGVTFLSTFGLSVRHWILWAAARSVVKSRYPVSGAEAYLGVNK